MTLFAATMITVFILPAAIIVTKTAIFDIPRMYVRETDSSGRLATVAMGAFAVVLAITCWLIIGATWVMT